MKMRRENLIPDGSMQIRTLTFALLGMASPWRCQEHYRPSALSIGKYGETNKKVKNDSIHIEN